MGNVILTRNSLFCQNIFWFKKTFNNPARICVKYINQIMKISNITKALMLLIAIYSFGVLFSYWETPLGRTPVLDGAENIFLAEKISNNQLPKEPFFRAMGYPLVLSVFFRLGIDKIYLHLVAGVLGIFLHLLNTFLIGKCAYELWKSDKAKILVIGLYGFYPIAVYYACDPLDITIANSFSLSSFLFILFSLHKQEKKWSCLSGVSLGLGVFFRPNILPIAGTYLFGLFNKNNRNLFCYALSSFFIVLMLGGTINYTHSQEFKILPWQGAYSLYAANCGNANGKFYRQTIYIPTRSLVENPARLESEIIYRKESGKEIIEVNAFNKFWRKKTLKQISSNPLKWIKLMVKKLVYIINDFEQYNNKTYSFHRSFLPLLNYNPLSWGIIFLLAIFTISTLRVHSRDSYLLLGFASFLAIGCLIYFASGRFRFLTVPFVILMTGGLFQISSAKIKTGLIFLFILAFPVYGNLFASRSKATYITDCLLIGHACARQNDFENQFLWANKALELDNQSLNGIRLKLTAFLNILFEKGVTPQTSWKLVENEINFLLKNKLIFNDTAFITGAYLWNIKHSRDKAIELWEIGRKEFKENEIFEIFLYLTGNLTEVSPGISDEPGSLLWICKVKKGIISATSENLQKLKKLDQVFTFLLGDQTTK